MSILDQLVNEIQQKHTNPTGTPSTPYVHGPNGLFGVSGGSRDVISSRVAGYGLASALPVSGSVSKYPLYPYLTGRNTASGSQAANKCDDAPTAGALLSGYQTAQFGLMQFATRELDLNIVGSVVNEGESVDLRFVNDPLVMQMGQIFPAVNGMDALQYGREVLTRFVEVGMDFQQLVSLQTYTGTGSSNQFKGLENLVITNPVDAQTGVTLTSLASDVRDFGDVDVTSQAGSAAIVGTIIDMYRNLKYNATTMGFLPATFAIVMTPQMFTNVTDVWACQNATFRCLPSTASLTVTADSNTRVAQDMRAGKFLWIDGERVPVIEDSWIPETDLGSNLFSSDIYILPMTVSGGRPVTYFEYFDYSRGTVQAIRDGMAQDTFWTDRGIYLTVKKPVQNWCTQWQMKTELRLRLETPMLAGRLQNVAMTLETHWRSPDTSSAYYVSSGNAGYAPPSFY